MKLFLKRVLSCSGLCVFLSRTVSSGGERFPDTEEVVGSIPILSISVFLVIFSLLWVGFCLIRHGSLRLCSFFEIGDSGDNFVAPDAVTIL